MPRRARRLDGSRRRRASQSCRTAAARWVAIACSAARMTPLGLRGSDGCCRAALVMMPTSAGTTTARRDGEGMACTMVGRRGGRYHPAISHQLSAVRLRFPPNQVQVPELVPQVLLLDGGFVGDTKVAATGDGLEQCQVRRPGLVES